MLDDLNAQIEELEQQWQRQYQELRDQEEELAWLKHQKIEEIIRDLKRG